LLLVGRHGHHESDAASVLGTVQGAALRSARAYARPSGLDGACAQMIGRQLRDGRRRLTPSGTHRALKEVLESITWFNCSPDTCASLAVEVQICDLDS